MVLAAAHLSCDEPSWGLDAIEAMRTPPDPPLSGPLTLPPDAHAAERAACAFGPGATAADTLALPPTTAERIPIRHVVVLMRENRSFDHLLGWLGEEGQPQSAPIPPSYVNFDPRAAIVHPQHAATTCLSVDPDHGWDAMHAGIRGGAMDGFVASAAASLGGDGHVAMDTYQRSDLPFYYWLASTWALDDRHFAAVASGTDPNRDFLLLATNDGEQDTNTGAPSASTPSIFRRLMDAGYTWGAYSDDAPFSGTLQWDGDDPGVHGLADFLQALDAGTLPNVAFVDGVQNYDDDHPPADLQRGEAWLRDIYQRAIASPQWPRLALIWTYDESGGFADHVPPPLGCVARTLPEDQRFFELGPRVPLVAISPYAKHHYVSHVVQDHTAITRFVEAIFGLPALTARDANSDALLDLFDFSGPPPMLTPPAAPPAGTNGCTPDG